MMFLGSHGKSLAAWPDRPLILKTSAGQVLHHGEGNSFEVADVRDLDDMRVRELDERADLAGEAAGELGVVHHRLAGNLDHDLGVDVLIEGAIDKPHSALTELGGDLVAAAGQGRAQTIPGIRSS